MRKEIFIPLLFIALTACQEKSLAPRVPQTQMDNVSSPQHTEQSVHPNQINDKGSIVSTKITGLKSQKILLDVPILSQKPELKYGCEVTSLAMLLQYAGIHIDKMELANQMPIDNDPIQRTQTGDITHWGNPNHGFVGDVSGKRAGYAIFVSPLQDLMEQYLPNRTVNLTGKEFNQTLSHVQNKKPVIIWTTGDFKAPDRWEAWKHKGDIIKTPLDLHVVVLVGYEPNYLYVNDPLTGKKAQRIEMKAFLDSWEALGKQALTYQ